MSSTAAPTGEVYLYGVLADGVAPARTLRGVGGAEVRAVPVGKGVAVLESDVLPEDVVAADDLLAHAAVLDAVALESTVVPLAFGTFGDVREGGETAEELVAAYSRLAPRLQGAVQLTLTARYRQETVLAELVEEDPRIARLRSRSAEGRRDEQVRLGELVVAGLEAKAAEDGRRIEGTLAPHARELRVHPRSSPDDVIELAALVDRSVVESFEQVAETVAAWGGERMRVRLVGPQAPYDFVEADEWDS